MTKLITWQEFERMDEAAQQQALSVVGQAAVSHTAVFQHTTDMLSYHNQLVPLIHLLQTAKAHSEKGSEWVQQTISTRLMDALIFQFLASDPADSATAPADLLASLQTIGPIEAEAVNRYLTHLSGYTQYQWQLEHLEAHPPQNMAALMIEFLPFAQKEAGVAYGRSTLMRQLLPTYFVERRTGQLNPRQDLGDLMRSGRPIPRPKPMPHPLAPNSETMQQFLSKLLNYDPVRPYAAAALFILMPTWLRFLQVRNLLTLGEATAALDDLAKLKTDLQTYFVNFAGDDEVGTAVANWPT